MLVDITINSICDIGKIAKLRENPKVQTTSYTWKHSVMPELIALGIVKMFEMIHWFASRR